MSIEKNAKEQNKGWKVWGIISIFLNIFWVLFFISVVLIGNDMIEKENVCAVDVCGNKIDAVSYYFDDYENICTCYNIEQDIIYQEVIR